MKRTRAQIPIKEQCRQRVKDGAALKATTKHFERRADVRRRAEAKRISQMIRHVEDATIARTLTNLDSPSFELQRQIIREIRE